MADRFQSTLPSLSVVVAVALVVLTAWGNAWVMFWCSLLALIAVLAWNVSLRRRTSHR